MSVELNCPQQGARAVTSADSSGKRAAKSGGATANTGNGFAALLNSLSSDEIKPADLSTVPLQAGQEPVEKNGLLAGHDGLPIAMVPTLVPNDVGTGLFSVALPEVASAQAPALLTANGLPFAVADGATNVAAVVDTPSEVGAPVPRGDVQRLAIQAGKAAATNVLDTSASPKLASVAPGGVATDRLGVPSAMSPDAGTPLPVNAWLAHRNTLQAQALSTAKQTSKVHQDAVLPALTMGVASSTAAWAMEDGGTLTRAQSRFGSGSNLGSSGVEGVFGGAATATNRAEAVFQVPSTSSVVADTAVAETVSYWAGQGVQVAELTLDGFGNAPVEVSILVNGDQAQVDFRTDQTAVRQVIESATAQLKELLSNQGLLLTSVSVGSFGKGGGSGDERRQRHGSQQLKMVKNDVVSASARRAENAAVGQSLDLFV